MRRNKLEKSMSLSQFDNGYWYANEIKNFAKKLGIQPVSKLRKDELEELIRHFLKSGEVKQVIKKGKPKSVIKDSEIGLTLNLPVSNYTNNKETKNFIEQEALKINPNLKFRSGVGYRLNRWREKEIERGTNITYEDIVRQFITLSQVEGSFPKAPVGRYINFLSDYMANEKGKREQAIEEWKKLKKLDIPKDYKSWKQFKKAKRKSNTAN